MSSDSQIRSVAVIGAGPTGVSAAKFLDGEQCFERIDVYEQQASFGGAWILSQPQDEDEPAIPQTNPYGPLDRIRCASADGKEQPIAVTPMYDNLETNIPHTLMNFSERAFPSDSPLFPSRASVLEYIDECSQEIKHLVKFGHQVTRLQLGQTPTGEDLWTLTHKNIKTGQILTEQYDAVALASGHFSHTSIPNITGIQEWNAAHPGSIKHSKLYRRPEDYKGKKVVIVGNASSGIDIGSQIAVTCQKPLILSARSDPLFKMPSYAEHINVPSLVEFVDPKLATRAVKFADGSLEENVDVVLFCTGYFISFPFLELRIKKAVINTGYMVHELYQHMFWISHPTLAFLGLPNKVLPLPLSEAQASALARVWSGRLALPTTPQMRVWEHQRWYRVLDSLKSTGKPHETSNIEKAFPTLGAGQDMEYHNELIEWAGQARSGLGRALPHVWNSKEKWIRSQMANIKKAYADLGDKKYAVRTIEEIGIDYEAFKREQEDSEKIVPNSR